MVPRGARLHAHFGWVAATAAWSAAVMSDARFTVVLHAFELHDRSYQDRFARVPLAAASTVFTISEGDRDLVAERWGIDARVLRMGVPRNWTACARVPSDASRIAVVGSLTEKKGHRVLLEALAHAANVWQCRIVGDGPLRAVLEAQVDRLGLRSRVEFLGSCDEHEIRQLLTDSEVFCLPCVEATSGDRDGIPVAIMEAMAVGVPVVTTRVSAIPELVDGVGVLVEPGDARALAQAIDMLRDSKLRVELSRAAQRRILDSWTTEASAAELADYLLA